MEEDVEEDGIHRFQVDENNILYYTDSMMARKTSPTTVPDKVQVMKIKLESENSTKQIDGYVFEQSKNVYGITDSDKSLANGGESKVFKVNLLRKLIDKNDDRRYVINEDSGPFVMKAHKVGGPFCGKKTDNIFEEIDTLYFFSQPQNQHPNVLGLTEYGVDELRLPKFHYVITRYVGQDLYKSLLDDVGSTCFTDIECKALVYHLMSGLSWMHRHGYAHRDLSPENIAFDPVTNMYVIIDFGLVFRMTRHGLPCVQHGIEYCDYPEHHDDIRSYAQFYLYLDRMKAVGKLCMMAPELFQDCEILHPMHFDIWAIGIIMYFVFTKCYPFKHPGYEDFQYMLIQNGQFVEQFGHHVSHVASGNSIHFMDRILQAHPLNRATLDDLLEHPWIQGGPLDNEM